MVWEYPDEVREFIEENVTGRTAKKLADLTNERFGTNFTAAKMKSYKNNHKLRSGTKRGNPKGYSKVYPPGVRGFIAKNVVGLGNAELAELVNQEFGTEYTIEQIKAYKKNNKLDSGLTGHFPKGHEPFNKGKKKFWIGGEETQFKKGHRPHNWVPLGTERISKDGYIEVKIREGQFQKNWRGKHILIWEKENGPLPEGHAIVFGDRDKRNFDVDNLICVSRAQLARLNQNGLIQNDADLTRTGVVIADMITKMSERKK